MRQQNRSEKEEERTFAAIVDGQRPPSVMHISVKKIYHVIPLIQQGPGGQSAVDSSHLYLASPLRQERKIGRTDLEIINWRFFACFLLLHDEASNGLWQPFAMQPDRRRIDLPRCHTSQEVGLRSIDRVLRKTMQRRLHGIGKIESGSDLIPDASMPVQVAADAPPQHPRSVGTASEYRFLSLCAALAEERQQRVVFLPRKVDAIRYVTFQFGGELQRLRQLVALECRLHQCRRRDAHPLSAQIGVSQPPIHGRRQNTCRLEEVGFAGAVPADEQVDSAQLQRGAANRLEALHGQFLEHLLRPSLRVLRRRS